MSNKENPVLVHIVPDELSAIHAMASALYQRSEDLASDVNTLRARIIHDQRLVEWLAWMIRHAHSDATQAAGWLFEVQSHPVWDRLATAQQEKKGETQP